MFDTTTPEGIARYQQYQDNFNQARKEINAHVITYRFPETDSRTFHLEVYRKDKHIGRVWQTTHYFWKNSRSETNSYSIDTAAANLAANYQEQPA